MPLDLLSFASNVSPIADNDAGLIIKADGSVQLFNTYGVEDPSQFTAEQLKVGENLIALTIALQVPAIMDVLRSMAKDPEIVGSTH